MSIETQHHCLYCNRETKWDISPQYYRLGYVAVCNDCYDGAPDSNCLVGDGLDVEEAVKNYNEQFMCDNCPDAYDPESEYGKFCYACDKVAHDEKRMRDYEGHEDFGWEV